MLTTPSYAVWQLPMVMQCGTTLCFSTSYVRIKFAASDGMTLEKASFFISEL